MADDEVIRAGVGAANRRIEDLRSQYTNDPRVSEEIQSLITKAVELSGILLALADPGGLSVSEGLMTPRGRMERMLAINNLLRACVDAAGEEFREAEGGSHIWNDAMGVDSEGA